MESHRGPAIHDSLMVCSPLVPPGTLPQKHSVEGSICPDPVSRKKKNKKKLIKKTQNAGRTKYNITLPSLDSEVLHPPERPRQPGPLRVGKVSRAPAPGTDPFRGMWTGIGGLDTV